MSSFDSSGSGRVLLRHRQELGKDYDRTYKIDRIRDWRTGDSTLKLSNTVASTNLRSEDETTADLRIPIGIHQLCKSTRPLLVHQTKAMSTSIVLSIL